MNHAAAGINHGTFRFQHHLCGTADLPSVAFGINLISRQMDGSYRSVLHVALEYVFGDVDKYRPWSAGGSDIEGFVNGLRQVSNVFDKEIMLGCRAGDSKSVGFLEGIGAD